MHCSSGSCTVSIRSGVAVILDRTANTDSTFAGWCAPACSGMGECVVTLTTSQTVGAWFQHK
jgi:hypothetical protein